MFGAPSTATRPHAQTAPAMTFTNEWQLFRYYILIAACVFARKAVYIKNACLAGALLFPAVAAIHGIVLAAFHREGLSRSPF